jgi:peptidoglycan/xylan/chitin deacetylase (PgdA/CDA1 family)
MRKYIVFITIILLLVSAINLDANQSKSNKIKKEICITFDELPAAMGFKEVDKGAINYLILQTLKKYEVKATGFVVGDRIGDSFDILGQWLNDGHKLGNMTFSNQDLHQLNEEQFIEDIINGSNALETMLKGFGQKRRYFRYPYLHYGMDVGAKEEVKFYLDDHQYYIGHATVVIDDYLYNLSLEKIGQTPDSAQFENLLNEYINYVLDEIEISEQLSKKVLKRPCKQIIRLTANRLNAVYLDEMLGAIKEMGYKFISLDEALKDNLYRKEEAYFGSRGVSYIRMLMESDTDYLPAE